MCFCWFMYVSGTHVGRCTYLSKVADTDGPNAVVFYPDPLVLVCEFKCCKTTQHSLSTQSFPPQAEVILGVQVFDKKEKL